MRTSAEPPTYEAICDDAVRLRELLAGSCIDTDADFGPELATWWEDHRRFIADQIPKPGRFLDFGCANGLLALSTAAWSPHELDTYGVDIDAAAIDAAKALFATNADHFVHADDPLLAEWGSTMDIVYWAVGDNVEFTDEANLRWLSRVAGLAKPGGRLVLGFYAGPEDAEARAADLRCLRWGFGNVVHNPKSPEEALISTDDPHAGLR